MAFKANGSPCDHFREHWLLNSGSFSTTAGTDSDFWRETAVASALNSRRSHVTDATAYATQPSVDSWQSRVKGWVNARYNPTASTAGGLT